MRCDGLEFERLGGEFLKKVKVKTLLDAGQFRRQGVGVGRLGVVGG